jgi:hypothetical protein
MIFKKLAMEYAHFDLDNLNELQHELTENCKRGDGPMSDLSSVTGEMIKDASKNNSRKRRDQEYICRDFVTALGLCHNVTPTFPYD